jgi:hypothetical protein
LANFDPIPARIEQNQGKKHFAKSVFSSAWEESAFGTDVAIIKCDHNPKNNWRGKWEGKK